MIPNIDSFSFIPDQTSFYNMRVGELLKEDLRHTRQFQGKVMSGETEWVLSRGTTWI